MSELSLESWAHYGICAFIQYPVLVKNFAFLNNWLYHVSEVDALFNKCFVLFRHLIDD